jgi:hypothetical protein
MVAFSCVFQFEKKALALKTDVYLYVAGVITRTSGASICEVGIAVTLTSVFPERPYHILRLGSPLLPGL